MTEAEWLACEEPMFIFRILHHTTERRNRLFACACCRQLGAILDDSQAVRALDLCEQFADCLVDAVELINARRRTEKSRTRTKKKPANDLACFAVILATWIKPLETLAVMRTTTDAFVRNSVSSRAKALVRRQCAASYTARQAAFLRDIFGNPFRPVTIDPAWRTATATSLAQAIYDERAFDRLPILADALEDAGCTNADILNHCRSGGEHVRGCWVVDLVLGKD